VPSVDGTKADAYRAVLCSLLHEKGVDVVGILNEVLEKARQTEE